MGAVGTSVYEELQRTRCLGALGIKLLVSLTEQELRLFPVLAPKDVRDDDRALEFAHDFFADNGSALTATLVLEAVDDAAVGRIMRTSIRRWLIDQARERGTGPVRRRIEKLLADVPSFELVPPQRPGAGNWRLAGTAVEPWDGDSAKLIAAADSVEVTLLTPWTSETRRSPVASGPDLVKVLAAMLGAAAGSVSAAELAHGMAQRFPTWWDPSDVYMNDVEHDDVGSRSPTASGDVEVLVHEEASEIFGLLSPAERTVLLSIGGGKVDDVMQVLACGRSSAYTYMKSLRVHVQSLVADSHHPFAVVSFLEDLCALWAAPADDRVGATSEHDDGTSARSGEGTL